MLAAASQPLNPPIQYSIIWLLIGLGLLLATGGWYGIIFWLTRHKPVLTLGNLRPRPAGDDMPALKATYVRLIEERYQLYLTKQIGRRQLHVDVSRLVRQFVYAASHIPATKLTLADFELLPYPALATLIGVYYMAEFGRIEQGSPATAVEAAKQVVQQWA